MVRSLLIGALLLASVQSTGPAAVTETQAREWALAASKKAAGNEAVFNREFRALVRAVVPDYSPDPIYIYVSEELYIGVAGQLGRFQLSASEKVRKVEDLVRAEWVDGVAIVVVPRQIGSLDIEKIVVKRGEDLVEPSQNFLIPSEMETRMGAKRTIHAGHLLFSVDAFRPGAVVTITAIPASGSNIVKSLRDNDLKKIR